MTITNFKKTTTVLFFTFCLLLSAQNKTELDTLRAFNFTIPTEVLEYQLNDPGFLTELYSSSFYKMSINDTSSVWMRTRMMIGAIGQLNIFDNPSSKILNPLYNDYLETQKLATLKAILGSVQIGAAAYLAYKHIKKYGFLKKK